MNEKEPVLDNAFVRLQMAASHAATSPHNRRRDPTERQAIAGNYKKARVRWNGLLLVLENALHSVRSGTSPDGKTWANRLAAHYGEIEGTLGNDGDPVDIFVGLFPELPHVWVINQDTAGGDFDEHKVMLGFATEEQARDAYQFSFDRGWRGLHSIVPCTVAQFKWWLKFGDKSRRFSVDQLPFDGQPAMSKTLWNADAEPTTLPMNKLVYGLRTEDSAAGLLLDAVSMDDIMGDPDIERVPMLDALVVEVAKLTQKMNLLQRVMNGVAPDLQVPTYQISDPVKSRGVMQVAVLFELSDGQTVTVWFHNPDTTPAKLMPLDELISWKWMLNKKDITIVVAPERGRDLQVREVARRVMKLADRNRAAFAKANAKLAAKIEEGFRLDSEIVGLEKRLAEVTHQVEVARQNRVDTPAAASGSTEEEIAAVDALEARHAALAEQLAAMSDTDVHLVAMTAPLTISVTPASDRDVVIAKILANHPDDIEAAIAAHAAYKAEPTPALEDPGVLPEGWTEASPGGMAAWNDPQRGGIVDQNKQSGQWFIVFNNDQLSDDRGFANRAEAFEAFAEGLAKITPAAIEPAAIEPAADPERSGTLEEQQAADAALAMATAVVVEMGGSVTPDGFSLPGVAGAWSYGKAEIEGKSILLAGSGGGVVQVNTKPHTDAGELITTPEAVRTAIEAIVNKGQPAAPVEDEGGTVDIGAKAAEYAAAIMAALEAIGWTRDALTPEFALKTIGGGVTGGVMNPEGNRRVVAKVRGPMVVVTWGDDNFIPPTMFGYGEDPAEVAKRVDDAVNALDPRQAVAEPVAEPVAEEPAASGPSFSVGSFLTAKFAKLNKQGSLAEYHESVVDHGYSTDLVKVEKVLHLTAEEYDEIAENLLMNQPSLGDGGSASDSPIEFGMGRSFSDWPEEHQAEWNRTSYRLGTVISAPGRETFVADAQGYDYARYVGVDPKAATAPEVAAAPAEAGEQPKAFEDLSFEEAKARADALWAASTASGEVMEAFPKGAMNITPDEVRATDEFKNAKAAADADFEALRSFNALYTKKFKKEIAQARQAEREAKLAAAQAAAEPQAETQPETEPVAAVEPAALPVADADAPVAEAKTEPEQEPEQMDKHHFHITIAADSIAELRKVDVDRVLGAVRPDNIDGVTRESLAAWITANRPDLAEEVAEVMAELPPEQPSTVSELSAEIEAQVAEAPADVVSIPSDEIHDAKDAGEEADRAFLNGIIDGSGDVLSEDTFPRMEPMFTKYAEGSEMFALLERAATVFGDAVQEVARKAIAA